MGPAAHSTGSAVAVAVGLMGWMVCPPAAGRAMEAELLLLVGDGRRVPQADDLVEELVLARAGVQLDGPVLPVEWARAPVAPVVQPIANRGFFGFLSLRLRPALLGYDAASSIVDED